MLIREWELTLPPVFLLVLIYTCIIAINCIIDIKCVICIISDPKSPGHTWADQLGSIWGPSEAVLIPSKCQRHFASRFAYDQHRRSKFLQGTPCFTAVEQLSELVATRRANMSTAMLRMASVSRAVGTKFCQWQNYANYEHTLYFWHNNINYVYYASKPGLVPGTNPGLDA